MSSEPFSSYKQPVSDSSNTVIVGRAGRVQGRGPHTSGSPPDIKKRAVVYSLSGASYLVCLFVFALGYIPLWFLFSRPTAVFLASLPAYLTYFLYRGPK